MAHLLQAQLLMPGPSMRESTPQFLTPLPACVCALLPQHPLPPTNSARPTWPGMPPRGPAGPLSRQQHWRSVGMARRQLTTCSPLGGRRKPLPACAGSARPGCWGREVQEGQLPHFHFVHECMPGSVHVQTNGLRRAGSASLSFCVVRRRELQDARVASTCPGLPTL